MQSRNSRVGESKRYLPGLFVRNTLEDSGSKDLPRERVPLNVTSPLRNVLWCLALRTISLDGCKPTTRHTLNIVRRGFQACRLSPTEKFRDPLTHIMLCAHHGNIRRNAQTHGELRGESRILKLPGGTRVFTASKGIRGRVELVRT